MDQCYQMGKEKIVKEDYAAREERKKARKQRKENKSSNIMHFRKMRAFNINHMDFIVIQNVYDFFLHKFHIAMNVYKKLFL